MTREEAARVLTELADEYEKYELSKNGWLGTTYIPAHRMGVVALRGPQPDPDTGMMPCGCGRAMRVDCYPGNHGLADAYQVTCYDCNVGTLPMRSAGKAQVAWNRAMGLPEVEDD